MPTNIRPVFETIPLAGYGGFLGIEWKSSTDDVQHGGGERFEVEQWEIEHSYSNATLPLSGGKGALSRRRAADDFEFACIVAFDLRPARTAQGLQGGGGFGNQPHVDGRLEGNRGKDQRYHIGIRFQCGDPAYWADDTLTTIAPTAVADKGIYYFCPRVLLRQVRIVTPTLNPDVVRAFVRGEGSAPLERYIDDRKVGTGGLDVQ
jgi:hypothetical protein